MSFYISDPRVSPTKIQTYPKHHGPSSLSKRDAPTSAQGSHIEACYADFFRETLPTSSAA